MTCRTISASLLLLSVLFAYDLAFAGDAAKVAKDAITIAAINQDGVVLNISNPYEYPLSLWVCDEPPRLNGMGFQLERLTSGTWKEVKPHGVVLGDSGPRYLQIAPHQSLTVPARFSPTLFGVSGSMKLRLVVRAWRTEPNLVLAKPQVARDKEAQNYELISPVFQMRVVRRK